MREVGWCECVCVLQAAHRAVVTRSSAGDQLCDWELSPLYLFWGACDVGIEECA